MLHSTYAQGNKIPAWGGTSVNHRFNAKKDKTANGDFAQHKNMLVQHSRLFHSVLGTAGQNYSTTGFSQESQEPVISADSHSSIDLQ